MQLEQQRLEEARALAQEEELLYQHLQHFIVNQLGLDPNNLTEDQWYEISQYMPQLQAQH